MLYFSSNFIPLYPNCALKKQCSSFYFDTDESAESKQVMKSKFVNSHWKSWTYHSLDTLINRFKKEQVRVASGWVSAKTKNVGIWRKNPQNNVLKNWVRKNCKLTGLNKCFNVHVASSLPCTKVVADLWSQPLKLFQA